MAGTIAEFFGYRADDRTEAALDAAESGWCPFIEEPCEKRLNDGLLSGTCSVKPVTSGPVICCPIRLYGDDYKILRDVADRAFSPGLKLVAGADAGYEAASSKESVIAVFGRRWGGELRLPQKIGSGRYWVDWILALIDETGELREFVAVEVQTIDTTGNYRPSLAGLRAPGRNIVQSTVGLNWENVSKRILPQLVFKGNVLQRERLCRKGIFFICPSRVYDTIMTRLGSESALATYPLQPGAITFMAYDFSDTQPELGEPATIELKVERTTTVVQVQNAFGNVTLPDEDVYEAAIRESLYPGGKARLV